MLVPIPITPEQKEQGLLLHIRRDGLPPDPELPRCLVCKCVIYTGGWQVGNKKAKYCAGCHWDHVQPSKAKAKRLAAALALLSVIITLLLPAKTMGQGNLGSNSSPVVNRQGIPLGNVKISVCQPLATTGASVTNNLAVLIMASNPVTAGYVAGMQILVSGFTGGDTYFNAGTLTNGQIVSGYTILSVTPTTITFTLVHANASASTNGTVLQEGNGVTSCAGLSSIFQDPALSVSSTNPIVSDQLGNWNVFAISGIYYVQFYSPTTTTTLKIIGVPLPSITGLPGLALNNTWIGNETHSGTETFTGSLNGHFWAGPGATPTIATQEAAAAAAGGGVVDIHPLYTGAESANCSTNGSDGFNTWGGNSTVTIVDWRQTAGTCQYSIAFNPTNAAGYGLTPFAATKVFSSPSTTASAAIFTSKYTGNLSAGGGNLNGVTAENDIIGNITGNPSSTVPALLTEVHVRSTSGTISDLASITAGASIDRLAASTNVTRAYGLYVNPCSNVSTSGAVIANCYGVYILRNTAGGTSNYGLFLSGGRARFGYATSDNGIDFESTGGVPSTVIQNDGTDTLSYRPLSDSKGFAWKNTSNVALMALDNSDNNLGILGVIENTAKTATMGLTLKKGSGSGNYTTASTTYVVPDSTNLCFTVTIPTGWKLGVQASGSIGTSTAIAIASAALTDNAACSTANAGLLAEAQIDAGAVGGTAGFSLSWVITGDGAAHNVALQIKTANGADSALLLNSSSTALPTMVFTLMPSN